MRFRDIILFKFPSLFFLSKLDPSMRVVYHLREHTTASSSEDINPPFTQRASISNTNFSPIHRLELFDQISTGLPSANNRTAHRAASAPPIPTRFSAAAAAVGEHTWVSNPGRKDRDSPYLLWPPGGSMVNIREGVNAQ